MLQRSNNLSPLNPQSDMEFLFEKIKMLEQELSDLSFEFRRETNERRRT